MKQFLLYSAFFCLAVFFSSCKKDKIDVGSANSYMSFKIDGVQKNYKAKAVAASELINDVYGLGLSAYERDSSLDMFSLYIAQKNKTITAGTYVDPGPNDDSLVVVGVYNPGTSEDAKTYAAGMQEDNNPRLHVTITSKTDKKISGTFYGTFYDNGGDGPGIAACTDGKFSLPLY